MDSCYMCGSSKETWPLWVEEEASDPYSEEECLQAVVFTMQWLAQYINNRLTQRLLTD